MTKADACSARSASPSPILNRTQRRVEGVKNRIFNTSMKLFLKKGYEATTVAEITEAADVAKGTFFTHFPTKGAIFGWFGSRLTSEMIHAAEVELRKGAPASRILRKVILNAATWHENNQELSRLIFSVLLSHSEALESDRENQVRLLMSYAELIAKGKQSKEFRSDIDEATAAGTLAGSYFFGITQWHVSGYSRSLSNWMEESLSIILRGLAR